MTTRITFDVEGLDEITERLNAGDAKLKIILNDGLRKIGKLVVPAKGTGPLADETPKRTGKLARSSFFQIVGGTNLQKLWVMQPAKSPEGDFYGEYVREGTPPHEIRPKEKKALHWMGESGEDVFATLVHHPGTKANPYHKRVVARLIGGIQNIINEMGRSMTAYISGR